MRFESPITLPEVVATWHSIKGSMMFAQAVELDVA
jgi:hypothetical protein